VHLIKIEDPSVSVGIVGLGIRGEAGIGGVITGTVSHVLKVPGLNGYHEDPRGYADPLPDITTVILPSSSTSSHQHVLA
jgi:hypothetical protein